jgi:hypothetical protein
MLLYELHSPCENKYSGELTAAERARCTREVVLSEEWAGYPRRAVAVENVCGRFENFSPTGTGGAWTSASGLCASRAPRRSAHRRSCFT